MLRFYVKVQAIKYSTEVSRNKSTKDWLSTVEESNEEKLLLVIGLCEAYPKYDAQSTNRKNQFFPIPKRWDTFAEYQEHIAYL